MCYTTLFVFFLFTKVPLTWSHTRTQSSGVSSELDAAYALLAEHVESTTCTQEVKVGAVFGLGLVTPPLWTPVWTTYPMDPLWTHSQCECQTSA